MNSALIHQEVARSVQTLRGSLRSLIVSSGADPRRPQEVHRRFGLDRGLCWKISRVIRSQVPEEALQHVPGAGAFDIFLSALARAGADTEELQTARQAMADLSANVQKYIGDRTTLELMLDGVQKENGGLIVSRKLAFRGNSGIWGVQARTRAHLQILAPNQQDRNRVDAATVAGWVDFRRLRPGVPWRVFHRRNLTEGATSPLQPIDPRERPGGTMLIRDFCAGLPPLITRTQTNFTHYEIGPSPAGSAGAFTLFSGFVQRAQGSRWAEVDGDHAELAAHVLAPVEQLSFDLLVHRSLPFAREASMHLFSASFHDGSVRDEYTLLPILPHREDLGSPPIVANEAAPRFDELVQAVLDQCGWKRSDFEGVRFHVAYPRSPALRS